MKIDSVDFFYLSLLEVRDIGCAELAPFDPDGRLLLNVNTPADYERAQRAAPDR
jgi:hypothetical protein